MTIGPTLSGGLKMVPDEDQDWAVLLGIADDGEGDLAKRLAGLMDEDSMWDEVVRPELEEEFEDQRMQVVKMVRKARKSPDGEVVIEKETAEIWYGALNQARIALNEEYDLGSWE